MSSVRPVSKRKDNHHAWYEIQATEHPIGDTFNDESRFAIPRYQPPYAWATEQAGEIFDNLLAAASNGSSLDTTDPYFLGNVVLVEAENGRGGRACGRTPQRHATALPLHSSNKPGERYSESWINRTRRVEVKQLFPGGRLSGDPCTATG